MTMFFGPRWDAPLLDDPEAVQLPETPTYARCLRCRELFVEGDQGYVQPYIGSGLDPDFLVGLRNVYGRGVSLTATHRECQLAGVVGHVVGVCACTGWDPYSRDAAREVQRRVHAGALG
ncbi:hypothetical protein [Pseudonocardia sp. D17]|uniref:hypothetical protein n=1 Tax=Pseudonocardia sp. D17 TaxID=882661 RepID=UPI002B3B7527|nr:hypothetical protein PSD17_39440 [Pseudonocardia sp. D17]